MPKRFERSSWLCIGMRRVMLLEQVSGTLPSPRPSHGVQLGFLTPMRYMILFMLLSSTPPTGPNNGLAEHGRS